MLLPAPGSSFPLFQIACSLGHLIAGLFSVIVGAVNFDSSVLVLTERSFSVGHFESIQIFQFLSIKCPKSSSVKFITTITYGFVLQSVLLSLI